MQLKEGGAADGLDALRAKPQLHGAVARSLCRGAAGRNYIIFTGPSITSLALFEEFEKQGRPGRAGVACAPRGGVGRARRRGPVTVRARSGAHVATAAGSSGSTLCGL